MTATETIDLTINATEVRSISDVASFIANRIQKFASKYGVGNQYDKAQTEEDMIFFLVKRNIVKIEELEVSILDNGNTEFGNTFTGRRRADLIFRIHYDKNKGYV